MGQLKTGSTVNGKAIVTTDDQRLPHYGTAAGTNTYTMIDATITSLFTGLTIVVTFTNANTAAATLNVSNLGAKAVTKAGGETLNANDIKAGGTYTLVYDGTRFQMQGGGGGISAANWRVEQDATTGSLKFMYI